MEKKNTISKNLFLDWRHFLTNLVKLTEKGKFSIPKICTFEKLFLKTSKKPILKYVLMKLLLETTLVVDCKWPEINILALKDYRVARNIGKNTLKS